MTTISPNRRRRGPSGGVFIGSAILVLCLLLVFVLRAQTASLLWQAVAPVLSLRNRLSQTDASLLRASLASTTAALADRDALYQQNLQLKALLGRNATTHTTLAAVLERPPNIPYDTLMIDIGSSEGVVPGALAFAGGNTAVGTVSDVYQSTSRVVLFSAPGQSYQAQLEGGVPLTLSGQGAGSMQGEVPAGTVVSTGQAVLLPGIALAFTGTVSYIHQESGASFITVYVQLPADVFSLQYVEVQTP